MMYEYKIVTFETNITEGDVRKGQAGAKVAAQVELQLSTLSKQGWEFYSDFPVDVNIKKGCLSRIFGGGDGPDTATVIVLVFRREVK